MMGAGGTAVAAANGGSRRRFAQALFPYAYYPKDDKFWPRNLPEILKWFIHDETFLQIEVEAQMPVMDVTITDNKSFLTIVTMRELSFVCNYYRKRHRPKELRIKEDRWNPLRLTPDTLIINDFPEEEKREIRIPGASISANIVPHQDQIFAKILFYKRVTKWMALEKTARFYEEVLAEQHAFEHGSEKHQDYLAFAPAVDTWKETAALHNFTRKDIEHYIMIGRDEYHKNPPREDQSISAIREQREAGQRSREEQKRLDALQEFEQQQKQTAAARDDDHVEGGREAAGSVSSSEEEQQQQQERVRLAAIKARQQADRRRRRRRALLKTKGDGPLEKKRESIADFPFNF
jgi:hypothetical protein